jgi:hypothetical protein
MEPRLFRHGNNEWHKIVVARRAKKAFQWSHVFSDMEMAALICLIVGFVGLGVSMEPRLFRHGNRGHFGPLPAFDLFLICEHLPFSPQNTS